MKTIYIHLAIAFLFSSFSLFGQVEDAAEEGPALEEAEAVSYDVELEDLAYGNKSHSNYIQFVTPEATRTIYFDKVTFVEEETGYSLHLPFFGFKPITPAAVKIEPEDALRMIPNDRLENVLSRISLTFTDEGNYNFERDELPPNMDCVLENEKIRSYWERIFDPASSYMSHELNKNGDTYILEFTSSLQDDEDYKILIHTEAEGISAISGSNDINTTVYYYPESNLLTYIKGRFGVEEFVPLPDANKSRSGNFDPEHYKVYDFNELSEEEISFKVYNVSSYGDDQWDQSLYPPASTGNPDLAKLILNNEMLRETIEADKIYVIRGKPVLVHFEDLPQEDKYCSYPFELSLRPVIGSEELPAAQSLDIEKDKLTSYKLLNSGLDGIGVNIDGGTVKMSKENFSELFLEAAYKRVKEKAGKHADDLIDFILYVGENRRELGNKNVEWWQDKVQALGVKNPGSDNPGDYIKAIFDHYNIEGSISAYIFSQEFKKKYGDLISLYNQLDDAIANYDSASVVPLLEEIEQQADLKVDINQSWYDQAFTIQRLLKDKIPGIAEASESEDYQSKFRVELYPNQDGSLDSAVHYRPSGTADLKISFDYEGDEINLAMDVDGEETNGLTFKAMENIVDVTYLLAALPALDITEGFEKTFYVTNYTGTVFGSAHYLRPVFNKITMKAGDKEKVNFINEEIETIRTRLTFSHEPNNTFIYPGLLASDGYFPDYLEVWIATDNGMPVKMRSKSGNYWLLPEDQNLLEWREWMRSLSGIQGIQDHL